METNTIKHILYVFISVMTFNGVVAQTNIRVSELALLGMSTEEGIKLRWGINNSYLWQAALDKGYLLERAIYEDSKPLASLPFQKMKTGLPIKQWEKNKWETFEMKNPLIENSSDKITYAHIAHSLIEELNAMEGGESFSEQMEFKRTFDKQFAYAMIAAEMSWEGALLQGLGFYDKNVSFGKEYVYKLTLAFEDSNFEVSPVYFRIAHELAEQNYSQEISAFENEQEIALSWPKQSIFSSYNIEISTDNINFYRDNIGPSVEINNTDEVSEYYSYLVDSLINYQKYYFKIKGNSPFGEEILIGTASGIPRDRTPPKKPMITKLDHTKPDVVTINWKIFDPVESDIDGFVIARSSEDQGDYYRIHEGLIPADWRAFQDRYFDKEANNFYIIEAVDTSGNRSRSSSGYLTLTDSIPPAIPIKIKGVMDSLGIVTLEVEPQKEKDFMGYRVYKANADDHEFSMVLETYNDTIVEIARNPVMIDTSTLESLTPFVYYKIGALDYNYNESPPSEIIKVPRPDKYPPVPPMINDYVVSEGKVKLNITVSTSVDTEQNYLYRRKYKSEEWILLDSLSLQDITVIDSTLESSIFYEYGAKAKDVSGLVSEMGNIVKAKTYNKPRPLNMEIECQFFENENKVLLTWNVLEPIEDPLIHKIVKIDENFIGRTLKGAPEAFVFNAFENPETLYFSSYTNKKQYLSQESKTCQVSKNKLENEEAYKAYTEFYKR